MEQIIQKISELTKYDVKQVAILFDFCQKIIDEAMIEAKQYTNDCLEIIRDKKYNYDADDVSELYMEFVFSRIIPASSFLCFLKRINKQYEWADNKLASVVAAQFSLYLWSTHTKFVEKNATL